MPRFRALALVLVLAVACGDDDAPPRSDAEPPPAEPLTIESILAPPGPDGHLLRGLSWRPDGDTIAFLAPVRRDSATGEEVLGLWLADPATGERGLALETSELLGGERQTFGEEERALRERLRLSALGITDYRWSPDGRRVLVPLSGDLHEHDLARDRSRRLTDTAAAEFDPRYDPAGQRIAFVRDDAVWVLDLATRRERRVSPEGSDTVRYGLAEFIAREELGRSRGFWWSPDGERIAYTEVDLADVPVFALTDYREPYGGLTLQRYPRAGDPNATVRLFTVRIDSAGSAVDSLSPVEVRIPSGPDAYLARVAWRSDGRLVVQTLGRGQDELALSTADPATGRVEPLLVDRDDEWIDLHDDLRWLAGGDFLWTTAESGWRHVVRHGPDGSRIGAITAGDWPVASIVGIDEGHGWVYITAQAGGPFERHLYRARLAPPDTESGPVIERVTREPGWHDAILDPSGRRFLDVHARATRPPAVSVRATDTGERIAWIEENRAGRRGGLVEPEFVWVRPVSSGGPPRPDSLPAALYRPADFDSTASYPVLVYTYGGPGAQVAKDDWLSRGRGLWHQLMVQRGYLVWMCDGRGSGARGKAWVETVHRRLGAPETEDQAACVRALWDYEPAADSTRTAIWGWSFGGLMAANALAREGGTWAAAAAVAPVTDWRQYDTAYTERYMERPGDNPEGYDETAPLRRAAAFADPFLLAWGTGDDNVHPTNSEMLLDALLAARSDPGAPPLELRVYPGLGHALGDPAARLDLYRSLTAFFDRTLRPGE